MVDFKALSERRKRHKKLEELYPLPRTSYSQLNTFRQCPHDFYLTYMQEERQRLGNKYTELGSLLHEIFEWHGKQMIAEKPLTKEDALKRYNKDFFKIDKKHYTDKEDLIKMYKKGVTALENFFGFYDIFPAPLYLEKEFNAKLAPGIPPMKAFVDRIDGPPDKPSEWVITDYKTGANPKSKDYLRSDLQLGLYCAQIFAVYGEYPKIVQFYHPVPDRMQQAVHDGDGKYHFLGQRAPVVEFTVSDVIIEARKIVEDIVECVESGEWKKETDGWGCKNCFNFDKCKPFENVQEGWLNV